MQIFYVVSNRILYFFFPVLTDDAFGLLDMDIEKMLVGADPSYRRILLAHIKGANKDWRDDNDSDALHYHPSDTRPEVERTRPVMPSKEQGAVAAVLSPPPITEREGYGSNGGQTFSYV